jgi:hypothetical protein
LSNRVIADRELCDWDCVQKALGGVDSALPSSMGEEAERLKARAMKFALAVCNLLKSLRRGVPGTLSCGVYGQDGTARANQHDRG